MLSFLSEEARGVGVDLEGRVVLPSQILTTLSPHGIFRFLLYPCLFCLFFSLPTDCCFTLADSTSYFIVSKKKKHTCTVTTS